MSQTQLRTPFLEGGIRSTNFFNGRLLSGEDMTTEHAAIIERECRLGKAVGSGVAYGLKVQLTKSGSGDTAANAVPVLTVAAGLAVNGCGQPVKLAQSVDVALISPLTAPLADAAATQPFSCCRPTIKVGQTAGEGVYLLTVAPTIGREGRAVVNGIRTDSAKCNSKYLVEAVQFDLIPVPDTLLTAVDFTQTALVRNRLAHLCFGTSDPRKTGFLADPFGTSGAQYGILDDLHSDLLTDCQVPLALIYWTESAVVFVDQWSVRRRVGITEPTAQWSLLLRSRQRRESEAMFLQFEEQIQALLEEVSDPSTVSAKQNFRNLPPVGLLPLHGGGAARGYAADVFFAEHASSELAMLNGESLPWLLNESLSCQPIDLQNPDKIQLYLLWENQAAIQNQPSIQPVLVFATSALPYAGVARFAYAHWGLSRVAPTVL